MPTKTAPKTAPKTAAKATAKTATTAKATAKTTADATPKAAPKIDLAPASATTDLQDDASAASATLKLRELVTRVTDATGGNKKNVKDIVEATLTQLGIALAKGEELNLPGIGKVRVARSHDKDGRTMMVLKVRSAGSPKSKDPLAADGEDV